MNYIFDSKTNAFYPIAMKDIYVAAGLWPESGVVVDENTFAAFQTPPVSKMRVADNDGYPAWADIPPPTHKEQVTEADAKKQSLIDQANEYINSKQWPGKAAMNRLNDAGKEQYNTWLDYLDVLEQVDTSAAPDITWPTPPHR